MSRKCCCIIQSVFRNSPLIGLSNRNYYNSFNILRMFSGANNDILEPYEPPKWIESVRNIPKYKVKLGIGPTPIHAWRLPGLPERFTIHIKRDDMTGSTLSGNKVRKLEFLFGEALRRGCGHVITCGGIQSNHCRATAIAATQLGLKTHLVLRADIQDVKEVGCNGNLLLNRLCGATMYFVPKSAPYETELKPRMEKIAQTIKSSSGEDSYHITVGGSDSVGVFGYITAFEELLAQGVCDKYDDIVFACGSGGTAAGLAIANYLSKANLRIHAVIVCDNAEYFHGHVNAMLSTLGLADVRSEDILDVIEGHKGIGYGLSQPHELEFMREVAVGTGIMLDPVYTGKAVLGLTRELHTNPSRFQGTRILYIHTGGVFGLYDGRIDSSLMQSGSVTNKLHMWMDKDKDPI